jgi:hypothetical protein
VLLLDAPLPLDFCPWHSPEHLRCYRRQTSDFKLQVPLVLYQVDKVSTSYRCYQSRFRFKDFLIQLGKALSECRCDERPKEREKKSSEIGSRKVHEFKNMMLAESSTPRRAGYMEPEDSQVYERYVVPKAEAQRDHPSPIAAVGLAQGTPRATPVHSESSSPMRHTGSYCDKRGLLILTC